MMETYNVKKIYKFRYSLSIGNSAQNLNVWILTKKKNNIRYLKFHKLLNYNFGNTLIQNYYL